MIETFTALLLAHAIADFTAQTNWIHQNKRNFGVMLLHGAIVLVTAQGALGQIDSPEILILALAHLTIDCVKTYGGFRGLTAFLTDQAAHIATIAALAIYAPNLWATGLWAECEWLLPLPAILAGLILCLQAGQYAVGLLMRPHRIRNTGLRDGGRQIGLLERGLIFVFVLTGQPLGVGFLIAAKSILRFGTASKDQRIAEYVIIGTLASFGWAVLAAQATKALLTHLPALEIARVLS